jgi:hypothetical protein
MDELKRIANGRRIACSESGYNDIDSDRQAINIRQELEFAQANGLEFWTYFQLNNDPVLDLHFGARYADYKWKPVIKEFAI